MPDIGERGGAPHVPQGSVKLFVAAAIAVAFVGFFVGTNPREYVPELPAPQAARAPVEGAGAVEPARSYTELLTHPAGSGPEQGGWAIGRAALLARGPRPADAARADPALRRESLEARAALRAFDGAPPMIPHPVRQSGASECLACHADGLHIGTAVARPLSHEAYASCTQCHVVASSPFPWEWGLEVTLPESRLVDLQTPARGARAWPGAPPVIPHPTWMRNRCLSCHGPNGPAGIRSSHPERQSCTQCHAPSAGLDQRAVR